MSHRRVAWTGPSDELFECNGIAQGGRFHNPSARPARGGGASSGTRENAKRFVRRADWRKPKQQRLRPRNRFSDCWNPAVNATATFPSGLSGAERQRRHRDVRPEDAVENQDHHLGVLQLQERWLAPERLDRPKRVVFDTLVPFPRASMVVPRGCSPGMRTHSIQNVALADETKALAGIAAAAVGLGARAGFEIPRNGMFLIQLPTPFVERLIVIKPRMSWPAIAFLKMELGSLMNPWKARRVRAVALRAHYVVG